MSPGMDGDLTSEGKNADYCPSFDHKLENNLQAEGNDGKNSGISNSTVSNHDRIPCSPLGYPPLFPASSLLNRHLNLRDISRWHTYEGNLSTTAPLYSMFNRDFSSLTTATENDTDTSPPGTAGSERNSPKPSFMGKIDGVPPTDGVDDLPGLSNAGPSSVTGAVSVLASYNLPTAKANDPERSISSYQTVVADNANPFEPYPFNWIQRAAEAAEHRRPIYMAPWFWDPDVGDKDPESRHIATVFGGYYDLDTEREDDELDDDDEDDDEGSVGFGSGYPCEPEADDDSLADLEDFLLYYHTGDLLFGPPALTTGFQYPPYSSHIDPTHTVGSVHPGAIGSAGGEAAEEEEQSPSDIEKQAEFRETVRNLKVKLEELRIRRNKNRFGVSNEELDKRLSQASAENSTEGSFYP